MREAMIQNAVLAGPSPETTPCRLALPRSSKKPPPPTSTPIDDEDPGTAKLYVQKAVQAAEEAWKQTIGELQGSSVTNPTMSVLEHPSFASSG